MRNQNHSGKYNGVALSWDAISSSFAPEFDCYTGLYKEVKCIVDK